MTEDRAHEINRAIVNMGMLTVLGLDAAKPNIELLQSVALRDMLEAVEFVKLDNLTKPANADGSRSCSIVPDPRLIAAVYTLLHYGVGPDESDELVAAHPFGGRVNLLIVGVRSRAALEAAA